MRRSFAACRTLALILVSVEDMVGYVLDDKGYSSKNNIQTI